MPSSPSYQERLSVAWWLWLPAVALVGLLLVEIDLTGPQLSTWVPYMALLPVATVGLWLLGRIRVVVADDEFRVDDARLPLQFISGATVLTPDAKRDILGPYAEPYAFVIQRPWIGGAVRIELDDPADPTPYWIVSSRHPDRLAAALKPASQPVVTPRSPGDSSSGPS